MPADELPALGEVQNVQCPNCDGREWSLAGGVKRMSRGFLRGWNYVAELQCEACHKTIAAGWGGELGFRDRIDARRRLRRRAREQSPRRAGHLDP